MTRRESLERLRDELAFRFCATLKHGEDAHMQAVNFGFTAALDLLWPCVSEAITMKDIYEKTADSPTWNELHRIIESLLRDRERLREALRREIKAVDDAADSELVHSYHNMCEKLALSEDVDKELGK